MVDSKFRQCKVGRCKWVEFASLVGESSDVTHLLAICAGLVSYVPLFQSLLPILCPDHDIMTKYFHTTQPLWQLSLYVALYICLRLCLCRTHNTSQVKANSLLQRSQWSHTRVDQAKLWFYIYAIMIIIFPGKS